MTGAAKRPAADPPSFGPARADDLAALVSIDRLSPSPWTADAFRAEFGRTDPTVFVLRSKDQVMAFAVTRIQAPEMDLVNLAVAEDQRRRGFGRLLVRFLLEHAALKGVRSVFLEVRDSNRPARRLYESNGFQETQRRRGFYLEPREDAILMSLKIEQPLLLKGSRNAC